MNFILLTTVIVSLLAVSPVAVSAEIFDEAEKPEKEQIFTDVEGKPGLPDRRRGGGSRLF